VYVKLSDITELFKPAVTSNDTTPLTLSNTPVNAIVLLSCVKNVALTVLPPEATDIFKAPLFKNLPLLSNTSDACVIALRSTVTPATVKDKFVEPNVTAISGTSPSVLLYVKVT